MTWAVRIPPELRGKVKELAAYEGKTEQEVATRILELFFEDLVIPKRESLLYWPPRKKKRI